MRLAGGGERLLLGGAGVQRSPGELLGRFGQPQPELVGLASAKRIKE
jgi:hypothetical protein